MGRFESACLISSLFHFCSSSILLNSILSLNSTFSNKLLFLILMSASPFFSSILISPNCYVFSKSQSAVSKISRITFFFSLVLQENSKSLFSELWTIFLLLSKSKIFYFSIWWSSLKSKAKIWMISMISIF